MARKSLGEGALIVGSAADTALNPEGVQGDSNDIIRLRLSIGSIQDLEDHWDCSLTDFWETLFAEPVDAGKFICLLAAMMGADPASPQARAKAQAMYIKAGAENCVSSLLDCLVSTMSPRGLPSYSNEDNDSNSDEDSQDKPEEEPRDYFWGRVYDMAFCAGMLPSILVQLTLPEFIHMRRGWMMRSGIDPDAQRKNPPMTRNRMKRLFDQHAKKQDQQQGSTDQ